MTISISLEGLINPPPPETRAVGLIKVNYNEQEYDWKIFIPADSLGDINSFLLASEATIISQIDEKEAEWAALNPKTRTLEDPFTGTITVPIERHEIVRPDDLDYYAKRRQEYLPVGEQLDAILKGVESPEFVNVIEKHQEIKHKYYKLPRTLDDVKADKKEEINRRRDIEEKSGFMFMGKMFDSDSLAVKRIGIVFQAALVADDTFTIDWTTQDGSVMSLSKANVMMLPATMAMVANNLHVKGRTLKAQVEAATTAEEVDAISW